MNEWVSRGIYIYICCSLSLMPSCFKIKYDHTQAQNEFLGFWLLITGNFPAFQGADLLPPCERPHE